MMLFMIGDKVRFNGAYLVISSIEGNKAFINKGEVFTVTEIDHVFGGVMLHSKPRDEYYWVFDTSEFEQVIDEV